MKFKEYLQELALRADTKIKVRKDTPLTTQVQVIVNPPMGASFLVTMTTGKFYEQEVVDLIGDSNLPEKISAEPPYKSLYLFFEDAELNTSTSPKEKGVAIKLFAALEELITKKIKTAKPDVIWFSGFGKSKRKLYHLLAKKIAKGIKGEYQEAEGTFLVYKT